MPIGQPLFDPQPTEVRFDEYEPFSTQEAVLRLRNKDVLARRVKVLEPEHKHFSVAPRGKRPPGDKVAAGMEAAFTVCFSPDHVEEYFCELVVVTEREKFAVPVRARGREPRLDIPPRVTFNDTAVRSTRRYTLHLTNVGSCEGRMRLNASPPFSVQPRGATVQAGESIQCVVSFNPTTEQEYLGSLDVSYDRGKSQRSELVGNGKEVSALLLLCWNSRES